MARSKKTGCRGCSPGTAYSSRNMINAEKCPQPIVKEDGSLLFKTVAPTLPGYNHDPINSKRLIPDSLPCTKRLTIPLLQRNGKYVIVNQCNHIECGMRGEEVNKDICSACPLRVLPRVTIKGPVPQPSVGTPPQ